MADLATEVCNTHATQDSSFSTMSAMALRSFYTQFMCQSFVLLLFLTEYLYSLLDKTVSTRTVQTYTKDCRHILFLAFYGNNTSK